MSKFIIEGQNRLDGSIKVQGSKNSALPILAATVAVGKPCVIHNCPEISDIDATVDILMSLGCEVRRNANTIYVDSSKLNCDSISDSLMREMRSSVIFMGALLSRTGEAELTAPGGCDIGIRPIDLHLMAMKALGIEVVEEYGRIKCRRNGRIKGAKITLSFPSVGATENIILASVRASGVTTIINAAREPEIADLAKFLNSCGAKISGAGESTVTIEGVDRLYSTQFYIIPDRIAACTYMAGAAVTGGTLILDDVNPAHLMPIIPCFEQSSCRIQTGSGKLKITAPERLKGMQTIRTMPYPGFPTDCQAIVTAMASVADGTTVIAENIFESRMRHTVELNRMGASITVHDKVAIVNGVEALQGAAVTSHDLRAGAALVVAGLCAQGETTVDNVNYIDRGYENLDEKLNLLGAKIKRTE